MVHLIRCDHREPGAGQCDHEHGCPLPTSDGSELHAHLAREGWTRTRDGRDYCPAHGRP
ncbi:hypothetical protein ACIO6U_02850 [Streptomyces sp. NPDC087422]|uniref:hypothetical protein n=1 Tax=Streptomyces sp. NPDC087422 TaxID=3365786 RepID=UPI003810EC46